MGLQFGTNFAGMCSLDSFSCQNIEKHIAGPYAGLIPDNVHPSQVGRASG